MIEIEELSALGFGAYRVREDNPEHRAALVAALDAGCNLIDTASNYGNGASERLIGSVLGEEGRHAFVVTKAGYVDGENLKILADVCRRGLTARDIGRLSESAVYTIHPEYLRAQMDESRARLGRRMLDALLLHNPEHLAVCNLSGDEIRARIRNAFAALEVCVAARALRWYGVSSNSFGMPGGLTVDLLLDIANEVTSAHHFRFVEMPLNLVEREALPEIAVARERGLITLVNRPLNALTARGPLRLTIDDADPGDTAAIVREAIERVQRRLRAAGEEDTVPRYEVLHLLTTRIDSLGTPDAVDALFDEHFSPLVDALAEHDREGDAEAFRALRTTAMAHALRANAPAAREIRRRCENEEILPPEDGPLPVAACKEYLAWGAHHVLVGMRRPKYVREMAVLFR